MIWQAIASAIVNNLGSISVGIGLIITILAVNSSYQKRKLAETKVMAAEMKAGATAIIELQKANKEIKDEFDRFQEDIKEDFRDMESRFETVRRHCEDSLRKYQEFLFNQFSKK